MCLPATGHRGVSGATGSWRSQGRSLALLTAGFQASGLWNSEGTKSCRLQPPSPWSPFTANLRKLIPSTFSREGPAKAFPEAKARLPCTLAIPGAGPVLEKPISRSGPGGLCTGGCDHKLIHSVRSEQRSWLRLAQES